MRADRGPWGEERCGCDGASYVVMGIGMAAGKMRTGEAQDGVNLNCGLALREPGVWRPKDLRRSNPAAESVLEYAIVAYSCGRS